MDLSISKGQVNDVTVLVNNTEVTVQQANNITVEVTPSATQYVAIDRGIQGATGTAATIAVGTTTTLSAGSSATVNNSGTSSDAVFNFGIPQGIQGVQGATGAKGDKGDTGAGVATGGTTGQVLAKASNTDYDTTWVNQSVGTGTVTSVGLSAPTGLSVSGSPVTTNGTLALSYASGYSIPTTAKQATWDTALQDVTSTDGSVTVVHTGTTADLSVAIAGATNNVICQVRNTTGATLTKGTAVYISGATGQLPTVSKALATSDATSAQTLGLMTADLANNSNGNVTVIGLITNIDTSAYTDGQQLYLSSTTAGALTATKQFAPAHLVYVAVVEHAHPTQGKLFVKVQNGYEMDELHNVSAQSPSNGNTLIWNASTNLWEAHGLTNGSGISVTNGAGSITVANTAPDQTVVMNSGTGISVTGTYPNFTVTNTSPSSGGTITAVTGTAPVVSSGGTAPAISMAKATTSVDGYLSSTDWNTFNNKTSNTGTVTSVGGTGTVSGINLSGTVTSSGNLTLGGTLDLSSPPTIGNTTPNTGKFTTLEATGTSSLGTASANYIQTVGGATTIPPVISAQGSDTNISLVLDPKGTGAVDIASGSKGVNISNGDSVTAINRSAAGSGYTSFPTLTISPPQTTGGVQAVASVTNMVSIAASVTSGGTGYTAGDVITLVGGTGTAGTFTAVSVSGGVITSVVSATSGTYTALPTNPVSVTGGTGTGATLTVGYGIGTSFTISTAGSGYVEQPAISFSGGGGGFGATAYAVVGAGAVIRSLGSTGNQSLDFYTPNSITSSIPTLRLRDGVNADSYPIISNSNGSVAIITGGSATASIFLIGGTGNISLQTGGSLTQFRAAHTASAVNYLQAAGGATTVAPYLSAQGADADIPMVLQPKGTGAIQAQLTTLSTTGGNARGANAVDWQTARDTAAKVASGQYANIGGGYGNTATQFASSIGGGYTNTSSNTGSFVGGGSTNIASGNYSVATGGELNTSAGFFNFIGGGFTNSGTSGSAVTTQSGTMNGTTAVTLSGSNANIKVGQYITGTSIAAETYVAAISGTALTLSKVASGSSTSTLSFFTPHGVVVGGGNNQATGSYSFIGGGGDAGTAANRNTASGDWSAVVGGRNNIASGFASFVGGGGLDTGGGANTNTASGIGSFIGGGLGNTASSTGTSVSGGYQNTANGIRSTVIGGRFGTTRGITGNQIFSACDQPISGSSGISQSAVLVLGRETTNATATVIASDANAASTTNQVILPNNSAYTFVVTVIAGVTGAGNTKSWELKGAIKRGAGVGTTAIVGTVTTTVIATDAGAATWTVTATADTTNGGLAITATGQAATTIRWVAKVETTEMTY